MQELRSGHEHFLIGFLVLLCVDGLKGVPFSEFGDVFDVDLVLPRSCVAADVFVFLLEFDHFAFV